MADTGHYLVYDLNGNIGHLLWDILFPSFHAWVRLLGEAADAGDVQTVFSNSPTVVEGDALKLWNLFSGREAVAGEGRAQRVLFGGNPALVPWLL